MAVAMLAALAVRVKAEEGAYLTAISPSRTTTLHPHRRRHQAIQPPNRRGILKAPEELNRPAANAQAAENSSPTPTDINCWVMLFGYTPIEAYSQLVPHRSSATRYSISDVHWERVRVEHESAGYDREAYEHSAALRDAVNEESTLHYDKAGSRSTLLRLGGVLRDEQRMRGILGLEKGDKLKITGGMLMEGLTKFCWLDDERMMMIRGCVDERREFGENMGSKRKRKVGE